MNKSDLLEQSLVKLEGTANFLRGMAMFDKSVPKQIADSILIKVAEIDKFTEAAQLVED